MKNSLYFLLILLLIIRIQTGGALTLPITAVVVATVTLIRKWYIKHNKN